MVASSGTYQVKICLFVFKCLDQSAPKYLKDLVTPKRLCDKSLRSDEQNLLDKFIVTQKRTGERSFAFNAAKFWNMLPLKLRLTGGLEPFKSDLKTHLFQNVVSYQDHL